MKFLRDPVVRMQMTVCLILLIVVSMALGVFVEPSAALIPLVALVAFVAFLALTALLQYLIWYRMPSRRCPSCSYDLTMSRPSTCPSCGAKL